MVEAWTRITNNMIHQQCVLHPRPLRRRRAAPAARSRWTRCNCVAELERCVNELGFVGAIVNPDPGADRQTPGMNSEYWYPLYAEAQRLKAPLIVHPSISRDPRLEGIPHSYQYNNVTEEALADAAARAQRRLRALPGARASSSATAAAPSTACWAIEA